MSYSFRRLFSHFSGKAVHFILSQTPSQISIKLYLHEAAVRRDMGSCFIFFPVRCLNTQTSVLALVNRDFLAQALVSVGLKIP